VELKFIIIFIYNIYAYITYIYIYIYIGIIIYNLMKLPVEYSIKIVKKKKK